MTRIILESRNDKDVLLIKELAERLKITYKIQTLPDSNDPDKNLNLTYDIINKGTYVTNYGDPSKWQKKIREDRNKELM